MSLPARAHLPSVPAAIERVRFGSGAPPAMPRATPKLPAAVRRVPSIPPPVPSSALTTRRTPSTPPPVPTIARARPSFTPPALPPRRSRGERSSWTPQAMPAARAEVVQADAFDGFVPPLDPNEPEIELTDSLARVPADELAMRETPRPVRNPDESGAQSAVRASEPPRHSWIRSLVPPPIASLAGSIALLEQLSTRRLAIESWLFSSRTRSRRAFAIAAAIGFIAWSLAIVLVRHRAHG